MKAPQVDRSRCVRFRYSSSGCRSCADACPTDAVHLERGMRIDPAACLACGLCAPVCPSEALNGASDDLAVAIPALQTSDSATIGCRQNLESTGDVRIGCFGGLSARDLASLRLLAERPVTLNVAACSQCPAGRHIVPNLLGHISEIADVVPDVGTIHLEDSYEGQQLDRAGSSRRGFFGLFLHVAKAVKPPTMAVDLIQRQQRHAAAADLASPETASWLIGSTMHKPVKLESCDECCRCVGFCPTKALQRQRKDGARELVIDAEACNGCGVCVEFCPQDGIVITCEIRSIPDTPSFSQHG